MGQLQDLWCGLEEIAGGAEVDGVRLGVQSEEFVSQKLQCVFVQDDPAVAGVVAVATDIAVEAVVQAAGREIDGGQRGEARQAR
jgi:hypothetical protein